MKQIPEADIDEAIKSAKAGGSASRGKFMSKMLFAVAAALLIFSAGGAVITYYKCGSYRQSYCAIVQNLQKYYDKTHQKVDPAVIAKVVSLSYALTPKVFPQGPFQPKDIITLAMIETDFNPYMIGKSGEIGVWQILDPEGNAFSLEGNCKAALSTLKEKYDLRGSYKMAIISYNGFSTNKRGELHTGYWRRFAKARAIVERMDGGGSLDF